MFHVVNVHARTDDEQLIFYNLWVIAGLSYRHRFESVITAAENKEKMQQEREKIKEMIQEIEGTQLYKQLPELQQEKIQNRIRAKEYLMHFDLNEVHFLSW